MPELLLEVGCEELPATFVRKAYGDLLAKVAAALGELYGGTFQGSAQGTPRRLIVSFPDVPARQPDTTKEVRGPALKAAYDEAGNPTPALQGFCRSNGADPSHLRKDEQYVWLTKSILGLPTVELLAQALPKAIKGLTFEKSMRWGSARLRFARPLRWILAAFDGAVVEFEIEGVRSGLESRGHRFYAPETFAARTLAELFMGLRERKVEPEVDRRVASIIEQANKVAGGTPQLPNDLVDENAFLTEWPTAIVGEFRPEHLSLPWPVLTTAMAKHERMFPVRNSDGNLINRFVFIRNSGEDDSVRKGAEWVLNARLDDAQFFFREDAKHDLDYFLEKTSGIVFQEKLGTVRERADRLEALAGFIAEQTGASAEEVKWAKLAGKYAKADLSTGLVSDMAGLQGIVGGEYAKRQGIPDPVCWAIASHYDHSKNLTPECEGARTAQRLCIADNLDKLVGFLGLGLVPTGSSDPFGLRRSATILIEIAMNWNCFISYSAFATESLSQYNAQFKTLDAGAIASGLEDLFIGRYAILFPTVRYDVLEAAAHRGNTHVITPQSIVARIHALQVLAEDTAFVQTATRPLNLLASAARANEPVLPTLGTSRISGLESEEGLALLSSVRGVHERLVEAILADDTNSVVAAAKTLQDPINAFMDNAMIMDPNPMIRSSRLSLLQQVANALSWVGDFTKLVIEG